MPQFIYVGSIKAFLITDAWNTTVELRFKGEVSYEVPAGFASKAKDPNRDWLTSAWRVGLILNFLKNMITRGLGDNLNVDIARLDSGSINDPKLSKEVTKLQFGPLNQRTIKWLDQSETIHLAISRILQIGVYFAYLGNHEVTTWINFAEILSRTRSTYLFLAPRIMGLISKRLRGRGSFIWIYQRELREL